MKPIGFIRTEEEVIPRHWTVSNATGKIVVEEKYTLGLRDIKPGQHIVVIFIFHKGQPFFSDYLVQKPPKTGIPTGVFSTCSPRRPNLIGMSVLEVTKVEGNTVSVTGVDMYDRTPVLDIKPYIEVGTREEE